MAKKGRFIGRLPDGKRSFWASQERVKEYAEELGELLEIIGHPEALITDLSSTGNFFSNDENEAMEIVLQKIGDQFGIETPKADESLVDIASRARKT
jgi:hypothetical protein